jgi:hypothetical protein
MVFEHQDEYPTQWKAIQPISAKLQVNHESADDVAKLWGFFGVYYQRVPEASPPGVDWETNRPYTYDVNHSDGFIVLDARLHERFFAGGMAKVTALNPQLIVFSTAWVSRTSRIRSREAGRWQRATSHQLGTGS